MSNSSVSEVMVRQVWIFFFPQVYLSFVYPNDFTRLTHMERENKCFYRESPIYLEKYEWFNYLASSRNIPHCLMYKISFQERI